jgi:hypothetical protein
VHPTLTVPFRERGQQKSKKPDEQKRQEGRPCRSALAGRGRGFSHRGNERRKAERLVGYWHEIAEDKKDRR